VGEERERWTGKRGRNRASKKATYIKSHQALSQAYVGPIIHNINFVLSLGKDQEKYKARRL